MVTDTNSGVRELLGEWIAERADVTRAGDREPISPLVRQLVYRRDNWSCQRCHARPYAAIEARRSGPLHLDHIVPWSAGGSDRSDNLRTLCGPCNTTRSNFVSVSDKAAVPIVGICAPCLAMSHPAVAKWCEQGDLDRFDVYCGSHSGPGWALAGWRIL